MRKTWRIKPPNSDLQDQLSSPLNITRITAQLLINRGITDVLEAKSFMSSSFSACHDPFLLKDMHKAVSRIKKAITDKEAILENSFSTNLFNVVSG